MIGLRLAKVHIEQSIVAQKILDLPALNIICLPLSFANGT